MEPQSVQPEPHPATAGAGAFTYAPGAKPLEGFTLRAGIGRGGFGEVYAATSDGGKEVALKLIRRNLDVELRGVRQCLNLKHPHLVMLLDIRRDSRGDYWVVMERVQGETLDQVIARHRDGMPESLALAWFHPVAQAVAYLHAQGIVHRDLKPGNIFNDQGVVKVGDYGLSKFLTPNRRSGQTENIGTVYYMAPEIAGGRYGRGIDIYALGVLLYEMLTGRPPFEGESVGEILMKHLTAQPPLERVPERFRPVVARALAKDPQDRFASVEEMLAQLPPPPSGPVPLVVPKAGKPERIELMDSAGPADPLAATQPAGEAAAASTPVEPPSAEAAAQGANAAGEPVLNHIRRLFSQVQQWLAAGHLPLWAKVLLVLGIVTSLVLTSQIWVPTLVVGAAFYMMYYLAWWLTQGPQSAQAPAAGQEYAPPGPMPLPVAEPVSEEPPPVRVPPPPGPIPSSAPPGWLPPWRNAREKWASRLGAFFTAGVVAPLLAAVVALLGLAAPWNQFLWLALCSTAVAWTLLFLGFLWAERPDDNVSRRLVLLVSGLGLGALAWWMQQTLGVHWGLAQGTLEPLLQSGMTTPGGEPTLRASMLYFGLLLGALRWWKQTELFRWTRVSLWAVAVCGVAAYLLAALAVPFPVPWGIFLAATVAVSVQMAAPWVPPSQRVPPVPESGRGVP